MFLKAFIYICLNFLLFGKGKYATLISICAYFTIVFDLS